MLTTDQARRIWRRTGLVKSLAREAEEREPNPQPLLQKGKPMTYELNHDEVRAIVRKQVFRGVKKAAKKAAKRAKKAQKARQAFAKSVAVDRLAADMRTEVEKLRQRAAIVTLQERFRKSTDPEERAKLADLGQKLTYLALKKAHRDGEI